MVVHMGPFGGSPLSALCGDAAAAKWQALAQQRKFTEVHLPDSCFVPMEGQPAGNVRRDEAYAWKCAEGMKLPPPGAAVTEEHRVEYPDLRDQAQQLAVEFVCTLLNNAPLIVEEMDTALRADFLVAAEVFLERPRIKEIFDSSKALAAQQGRGDFRPRRCRHIGSFKRFLLKGSIRVPSILSWGVFLSL